MTKFTVEKYQFEVEAWTPYITESQTINRFESFAKMRNHFLQVCSTILEKDTTQNKDDQLSGYQMASMIAHTNPLPWCFETPAGYRVRAEKRKNA